MLTSSLGGYLSTIALIAGSCLSSSISDAFFPIISSAISICFTLTVTPGKFTLLESPNFCYDTSFALVKFLTTIAGVHISSRLVIGGPAQDSVQNVHAEKRQASRKGDGCWVLERGR